jgi:hypothetical protein
MLFFSSFFLYLSCYLHSTGQRVAWLCNSRYKMLLSWWMKFGALAPRRLSLFKKQTLDASCIFPRLLGHVTSFSCAQISCICCKTLISSLFPHTVPSLCSYLVYPASFLQGADSPANGLPLSISRPVLFSEHHLQFQHAFELQPSSCPLGLGHLLHSQTVPWPPGFIWRVAPPYRRIPSYYLWASQAP